MARHPDTNTAVDDGLARAIPPQPDRRRAEAVHRLQIGLAGLGAMVLLIGLASVIMERAQLSEPGASSDTAAATTGGSGEPKNDPLAEAGVVPDMPSQSGEQQEQEPAIVPEQGDGGRVP